MTGAPQLGMGSAGELLLDLIGIESVNPTYHPLARGENDLGDAIVGWARARGCDAVERDVVAGRRNVVFRVPSREPRRRVLIEGHLDTVGLSGPNADIRGRIEDGRVRGRGACDAKGGIAATLLALDELVARPPKHTDVLFLGAIDEEHLFRGISAFIADGDLPDAAIVLEPTDLRIVTEHNGVVRIELLVTGRAAHTSRPEDGHNAILDAAELIRVLEHWNASDAASLAPLPPRILAVTTIAGGTAINVIPDECRVGIDLRIRPDEDPADVLAELERVLASLVGPSAAVDRVLLTDGGMSTSSSSELVVAAQRAVGLHQLPVEVVRVPYGTDGSKLARAGVPTIVFGPGSIRHAHSDDEWVDLADVERAARVLVDLVHAYDEEAS